MLPHFLWVSVLNKLPTHATGGILSKWIYIPDVAPALNSRRAALWFVNDSLLRLHQFSS